MSVFLDDCSGDVDCVYFFDGGACATIWHGNVLPAGGIPPKSLLYLFVNETSVPTIPLESVFALTPLISEGRFHIIKTAQPNSTPVLVGFYAGILHCHSSPEIRFTLVSKDQTLDVVVDQLASQGRTVKRIPAEVFSDLFSPPTSSPPASAPSSRPSSSASNHSFLPGILSSSHVHSSSPQPSSSGVSQLVLPPNLVVPPAPSPKLATHLTINTNNSSQSDADMINELAHTENFNKKTKKKIINKITNRKDLQVSLINKLLELNNIERAAYICSQFGLHSQFPNLPPPLIPQPTMPASSSSSSVSKTQIPPSPSILPATTTTTTTTTTNTTNTTNTTPTTTPQKGSTPPPRTPTPQKSNNTFLPSELNSFVDTQLFQDDAGITTQAPQTPTAQELQQMQNLRRQASAQPSQASHDQIIKASPKKKAQQPKAAKPPATPKKQGVEASPNLQETNNKNTKQNDQNKNENNKNATYVPKTPKTPTTPKAPSTPLTIPNLANIPNLPNAPELPLSNLPPNGTPFPPNNLNFPPNIFSQKNAVAIKAIQARLLHRMYPHNHAEIRMQWEEPLESALQCMAHMNVTDKHDDPESRFLVQLLLATMLESGLTVSEMARQGNLSFSVHENEAVIQETWKHLSHWEYAPEVLSAFKDVYMNGSELYNGNSVSEKKQTDFVHEIGRENSGFIVEHDSSEDEHAWVEGWITRRIISAPNEEGQTFT